MSKQTDFPSTSQMFPGASCDDVELLRKEVVRGMRDFRGGLRISDSECEIRLSDDYSPDDIATVAYELKEQGFYVRSFRGHDASGIHEIGIGPGWYRGLLLRRYPFAPLPQPNILVSAFTCLFRLTTYVDY